MNEFEILQGMISEVKDNVKSLDEKVDCLEKKIVRYKGFMGGVTFVLSCLGAFFAMALKIFKGGNT